MTDAMIEKCKLDSKSVTYKEGAEYLMLPMLEGKASAQY